MTDEWQTVALYVLIGGYALFVLWRWHRDPSLASFRLVDLIAENGALSSRKFMEFGAWVIASVAFVVMTIRGTITAEWLIVYTSVFVLGRAAGQALHTYQATTTRKAEIQRGRKGDLFTDSATVEDEESDWLQGERRNAAGGRSADR